MDEKSKQQSREFKIDHFLYKEMEVVNLFSVAQQFKLCPRILSRFEGIEILSFRVFLLGGGRFVK